MNPGFLDPLLAPEYLRSQVMECNVAFASCNELTELLIEDGTELPVDQFLRLADQRQRAQDNHQKRYDAIVAHLQNESAIIRERLGLDADIG